MNKEQIGEIAARQYSQLRRQHNMLNFWTNKTLSSHTYLPALERIGFENQRQQTIKHLGSTIAKLNLDARNFYNKHHAQLYEMATEEMNAASNSAKSDLNVVAANPNG